MEIANPKGVFRRVCTVGYPGNLPDQGVNTSTTLQAGLALSLNDRCINRVLFAREQKYIASLPSPARYCSQRNGYNRKSTIA